MNQAKHKKKLIHMGLPIQGKFKVRIRSNKPNGNEAKNLKEPEEVRVENNEEETTQEMDLEKVQIYIQSLEEVHGEKEVDDMTIGHL